MSQFHSNQFFSNSEIPKSWSVERLKFCCSVNDDVLSDKTDIDYEIQYVDISSVNLIDGITNIETMTLENAPSRARRVVKDGDSIVSTVRTYLKAIATIENPPENLVVSTGFAVIRANSKLYKPFLAYQIQAQSFVDCVGANSKGVSYPAINPSELASIPIAFPEFEIQQKIAEFLDFKTGQIDALIAKKQSLIEKLQEERIAVITQAVTQGLDANVPKKDSGIHWLGQIPLHWEVKKIRDIFKFGRGLGITKSDLKDEGIPCINYGEIHSKYGFECIPESQDLKFVDKSHLDNSPNSLLKNGDFVFADTSEDIKGSGNFTYLNSTVKTFAGYHTVIARLNTKDVPRYMAYLFESELFRFQIRKNVTGVKVFSVTQAILKDCVVWLPSIEEQIQIINHIDTELTKIDRMISLNQHAIEKYQEYRTALITAAVTGKIDVRDVNLPTEAA